MYMHAHLATHNQTHTRSTCMASLGNVFSLGRIYDSKQRVMKPREIFTVSVRAYYPGEGNGVNWKYLLKTACCLLSERKKTVFPLCHQSSNISNSEVSVEASNINKTEINEQFSWELLMFWLFYRSTLPMVQCLITLLRSITFTVQLMWHLSLFKVYTRPPCEHRDDVHSPYRSRAFVWCACHCLVPNSMTDGLLEKSHFMN